MKLNYLLTAKSIYLLLRSFGMKNLGHQVLYLLAFDPTIPNWYTRLGWTHIGDDELFSHRVTVMSIAL